MAIDTTARTIFFCPFMRISPMHESIDLDSDHHAEVEHVPLLFNNEHNEAMAKSMMLSLSISP
jgi:hypothetical protein